MIRIASVSAIACLVASSASAQPFFENFNDGNDDGWTRLELSSLGSPGVFSFPSGGYRLVTGPTSNPALFGPSRVGSVAPVAGDVGSDFFASVDILSYDRAVGMVHGLGFRGSDFGIGTSEGYYLWVFTSSNGAETYIGFNRLDNEVAAAIGAFSPALPIAPNTDLRLTVQAAGGELTGRIYNLAAPAVPLYTIYASDSTHPSGATGIAIAGLQGLTNPPLDGTFDNFLVVDGPRCAADLTHGAIAGAPNYGLPNGALDNEDFFYYLAQFAVGNTAVADLTTGAVAGQAGYGVPDGVLNNEDFFYYLAIFAAGC